MDDETTEEPIRQRLRTVQLLDCSPGRLHDPEVGTPVMILTLGSKGEVEQPVALTLKDTQRLARDAMIALATLGDETAERACREIYGLSD